MCDGTLSIRSKIYQCVFPISLSRFLSHSWKNNPNHLHFLVGWIIKIQLFACAIIEVLGLMGMANKNNGNLRTPSTLALNAMVICEVSFLYLAICCWTIVWSSTILYYKVVMFYPCCICCIRHHYINTSLISWACLSMHSDHFELMAREKKFQISCLKIPFCLWRLQASL